MKLLQIPPRPLLGLALLAALFASLWAGQAGASADSDPHRLGDRDPPAPNAPPPLDGPTRRLAVDRLLELLGRHYVDAERVAPERLAAWRESLLAESLDVSDDAFWERLDRQLGELADSHTRLQSPAQVRQRGREPQPGLRGRTLADGALQVDQVLPGSTAEKAGVQAGWRLLAVNGERWAQVWQRAEAGVRRESSLRAEKERALQRLWLQSADLRLGWRLDFALPDGALRSLRVLPPQQALAPHHEALAEGLLRIWLPLIDDAAFDAVRQSLGKAPRGLVLDLRGNRGGDGAVALALAGLFIDGQPEVARLETRSGEPVRRYGRTLVPLAQRLTGSARYTGPLVLLVDAGTGSSAELLAAVLQQQGRAAVLGQPSCGCMNPSLGWFGLPGGAQLLVSEARLPLVNGTRIEGRGVLPDEALDEGGGDAALAQALRRLQRQTRI